MNEKGTDGRYRPTDISAYIDRTRHLVQFPLAIRPTTDIPNSSSNHGSSAGNHQ